MTSQDISYMTVLFQTICDNNRELKKDSQMLTEQAQTLVENMQAFAFRAAGDDQTHQTFKEMYEKMIRSFLH